MPAGGLVVKRRLADAALMEMRLNERKQQNEHNQKKGIVNRKIIPQTHRNVYPKQRFWVHIGRQEPRRLLFKILFSVIYITYFYCLLTF